MARNTTKGTNYDASEESTRTEIVLGKAEGKAYAAALTYLAEMEASDSGQQSVGDYIIDYAIEDAEGLYHMNNGRLEWREPTEENCHVEIAVRNAADGRFLPGLSVRATLIDSSGNEVGSHEQPFLWHPWIYHYGRNWSVPQDGQYTLKVHVDPPAYSRHDRINGKRFESAADVEFQVQIKTGRKVSKAA